MALPTQPAVVPAAAVTPPASSPPLPRRPIARDFFAASTASVCANVATQPFETIKVHQIVGAHGVSTWRACVSIVQAQGWRALYKGTLASCIRGVVNGGGRLTGYHMLKDVGVQHGWITAAGGPAEVLPRAAMAVTAATVAIWLAAPIDLVRTRQAAYGGNLKAAPSIWKVVSDEVKGRGLRGLFTGSTALVYRSCIFNVSQLLTYDESKIRAQAYTGLPGAHVVVHLLAALGAGLVATTASSPMENVKTIMQANTHTVRPRIGAVCMAMWRQEGIAAFFRGWTALYVKTAPHTLLVFLVMEQLQRILGVQGVEHS